MLFVKSLFLHLFNKSRSRRDLRALISFFRWVYRQVENFLGSYWSCFYTDILDPAAKMALPNLFAFFVRKKDERSRVGTILTGPRLIAA